MPLNFFPPTNKHVLYNKCVVCVTVGFMQNCISNCMRLKNHKQLDQHLFLAVRGGKARLRGSVGELCLRGLVVRQHPSVFRGSGSSLAECPCRQLCPEPNDNPLAGWGSFCVVRHCTATRKVTSRLQHWDESPT